MVKKIQIEQSNQWSHPKPFQWMDDCRDVEANWYSIDFACYPEEFYDFKSDKIKDAMEI